MKNRKGFTLIELLAVITILGILMLVGIPAVSRIIENSRRDSMVDTLKSSVDSVRNAISADNLSCTVGGSNLSVAETGDGTYYIGINELDDLMEKPPKSPWGGKNLSGYIEWTKSGMTMTYFVDVSDSGKHGTKPAEGTGSKIPIKGITRSNIATTGVTAGTSSGYHCTASVG